MHLRRGGQKSFCDPIGAREPRLAECFDFPCAAATNEISPSHSPTGSGRMTHDSERAALRIHPGKHRPRNETTGVLTAVCQDRKRTRLNSSHANITYAV